MEKPSLATGTQRIGHPDSPYHPSYMTSPTTEEAHRSWTTAWESPLATDIPSMATTSSPTPQTLSTTSPTPAADSLDGVDGADNDAGRGGGGIPTTTKVAIAVPVAVVGTIVLAALIFFLLKRRQRKQPKNVLSSPSQTEMNLGPASSHQQSRALWTSVPQPAENSAAFAAASIPRRPVPQTGDQEIPAQGPGRRGMSSESGRGQSRFIEHENLDDVPRGAPVVIAAQRSVEQRPGTGQCHSQGRPQSPFDHPLDDAMSDISELSDKRLSSQRRGLDDDVSSVSSFEDDDHRGRNT
ncbi:hypothetical protein HFD88_000680 [Aspergillus terreus]|nr:hypothetical protein HFD88_000680 [Aspergillus terreus]